MTHDKTARLSFAPNNTEPQIQGKLWILFIKTPFDFLQIHCATLSKLCQLVLSVQHRRVEVKVEGTAGIWYPSVQL